MVPPICLGAAKKGIEIAADLAIGGNCFLLGRGDGEVGLFNGEAFLDPGDLHRDPPRGGCFVEDHPHPTVQLRATVRLAARQARRSGVTAAACQRTNRGNASSQKPIFPTPCRLGYLITDCSVKIGIHDPPLTMRSI